MTVKIGANNQLKNWRSQHLFKQARPGTQIIAFFAAVQGMFFEIDIYSDQVLARGVFSGLLALAAAVYFLYNLRIFKIWPWLGVALCTWYTGLAHLYLSYNSVPIHALNFNQGILILLGLLFFPFSPGVFLLISMPIFLGFSVVGALCSNMQYPVFFTSYEFTFFCAFTSFIALGFYFNNALRMSLYRKSMELKSQLDDREKLIQQQIAEITSAKISHAVASTTQMLAHDVRKPFATLKAGMQMIKKSASFEDVQSIVNLLSPQIEKAFLTVNSMLKDIYGVRGDRVNIEFQDEDPTELIGAVLDQVLLSLDMVQIKFFYDLNHQHKIKVQKGRIERVFIIILSNAIEAMKHCGEIRFRTLEVTKNNVNFIQFEIVNNNSKIDQELMETLFDPFTSGQKKGGTGLGLAIAKHIIQDHGGGIECLSEREKNEVKFTFILLASEHKIASQVNNLPLTSQAVRAKFQPRIVASNSNPQDIDLVVVEDSEFMHTAWMHAKDLNLKIKLFYTPEEFLAAAKLDSNLYTAPRFFLLDYDYGEKSYTDGFRLAELIRKQVRGKIFFYSDMDFNELPTDFDNRVPKEVFTLSQLEGYSQPRGIHELK